jgi:hypothetical protein
LSKLGVSVAYVQYLLYQASFPLADFLPFPSPLEALFALVDAVFGIVLTSDTIRFFRDVGGGDIESAGRFSCLSSSFDPTSSFAKRARSTSAGENSEIHS